MTFKTFNIKFKMICLSRLTITNIISVNTPECVLLEIAEAHGLIYTDDQFKSKNFLNEIIMEILSQKQITIKSVNASNVRMVARFINAERTWNMKSLKLALAFLLKFTGNLDPKQNIDETFSVGKQTPENPQNINACMLFRICIYHNIYTSNKTTIQEMESCVRMLFVDKTELYSYAMAHITQGKASHNELINFLRTRPSLKTANLTEIPEREHVDISETIDRLNSSNYLYSTHIPVSDFEAVVLGWKRFGIDLGYSKTPVLEYQVIMNVDNVFTSSYVPVDPWMRHWYLINKDMFNINKTLCISLPYEYYHYDILHKMVISEGYTISGKQSIYNTLMEIPIRLTFYNKMLPKSQTIDNITLEELHEIPESERIWYGSSLENLELTSVNTLIRLFETNQNFKDPWHNDKMLSREAIRKLSGIINNDKLYNLITSLEIQRDNINPLVTDLMMHADKESALGVLQLLLEYGMYMRAWKGPGYDYPVGEALLENNRVKVWENAKTIFAAEAKYTKRVRESDVGYLIDSLPLVQYCGGEFQESISTVTGLTIRDRIDIIKSGTETNNMESCVRMSSNWIVWSAYKYLTVIGHQPNFRASDLREIL